MYALPRHELDALILVGDDPAIAERCLSALVAVSLDMAVRTWVVEVREGVGQGARLHERCVWTRAVAGHGSVQSQVERALSEGHAPLVLVLDGSAAIDADTLREALRHMERQSSLAAVGLGALGDSPRGVRGRDLASGRVGPLLALRRTALDTIGGFGTDRFAGAQAEFEAWCRRAERAGLDVALSAPREALASPAIPVAPEAARLRLMRTLESPVFERRTFRDRPSSVESAPEDLGRALLERVVAQLSPSVGCAGPRNRVQR